MHDTIRIMHILSIIKGLPPGSNINYASHLEKSCGVDMIRKQFVQFCCMTLSLSFLLWLATS